MASTFLGGGGGDASIVGGGGGGGGAGDASAANQTLQLVQLQEINADLGAPNAAAANSDDGTFGLLPLVKRLLGKIPALVSGRIPVDNSGVIQLGSGAVTASTQRVTLASDGPEVTSLSNIDNKTAALIEGRSGVEPLGRLGVARQQAFTSASANLALTSTCRRVSILARGADCRIAIGSTGQTASATSHYMASGERMDLAVPATPNIAVIRAGSTDGTLEVSELL